MNTEAIELCCPTILPLLVLQIYLHAIAVIAATARTNVDFHFLQLPKSKRHQRLFLRPRNDQSRRRVDRLSFAYVAMRRS